VPETPDLGWDPTPSSSTQKEYFTPATPGADEGRDGGFQLPDSPGSPLLKKSRSTTQLSHHALTTDDSVDVVHIPAESSDKKSPDAGPGFFWRIAYDDVQESTPHDQTPTKRSRPEFQVSDLNPSQIDFNFTSINGRQQRRVSLSLEWVSRPVIKVESWDSSATTLIEANQAAARPDDLVHKSPLRVAETVSTVTAAITTTTASTSTSSTSEVGLHTTSQIVAADGKVEGHSTTTTTTITRLRFPKKSVWSWASGVRFSRILPLETVKRLVEDPGRCVAGKAESPGIRCSHRTKLSQQKASLLLKRLANLKNVCEFSDVAIHILELVENAVCKNGRYPHREKALVGLRKLCDHLYQSKISATKEVDQEDWVQLEVWLQALTSSPIKLIRNTVSVTQKTVSVQEKFDPITAPVARMSTTTTIQASSATIVPSANANCPILYFGARTFHMPGTLAGTTEVHQSHHLNHPEFRKYHREEKPVPADVLIKSTLKKPLTAKDIVRSGFIYVYWQPGNFSYVKIGYAGNVAQRLSEWEKQCGYAVQEHTLETPSLSPVPHTKRVEDLVHAELKDQRLEEPECEGCGTTHTEWFNVTPDHALRVAKKWTIWMQDKRPYDEKGVLKAAITDSDIEQLCTLTKDEPEVKLLLPRKLDFLQRSERRSKSRRKSQLERTIRQAGTVRPVSEKVDHLKTEDAEPSQEHVTQESVDQPKAKQTEVNEEDLKQEDLKQEDLKQEDLKQEEMKKATVHQAEEADAEEVNQAVRQEEVQHEAVQQRDASHDERASHVEVKQEEADLVEDTNLDKKAPLGGIRQEEVDEDEKVKQGDARQDEAQQEEVNQDEKGPPVRGRARGGWPGRRC
jgi:hypothetical protein